nr:unnamed protein product [Hydra vulgaris]XP_012563368.1 unnamed protein product [Hydra vulgaris]
MPLVQNKSSRSIKSVQDYIDNKVPENFIPGWSNPPPNNKNETHKSLINFLRIRLIPNNQNEKNKKGGISNNFKNSDSKKNSNGYCDKNSIYYKESNSSDKMKRRSFSLNQLSALEDSYDLVCLSERLKVNTVQNEGSSHRLPKSFKPTNNISLLHPEIFVPIKRKISNIGRSYSLTNSNLYSTPMSELCHRTRSQSLFDDQLKLKKKLSTLSPCNRLTVGNPLPDVLNDSFDTSLFQTDLKKCSIENISSLQLNHNDEKISAENSTSRSLEVNDTVNCNTEDISLNENNNLQNCFLKRSYSELQLNVNKVNVYSVIPEIHVQVNDSCVKLNDDESKQINESKAKYVVIDKSNDFQNEQNLYRPRSQSLTINKGNDEKLLQSPTLRRQSWSSSFLKATSLVELNCRKIKVIKTEQYFAVRKNSYHKSDNMYCIQGSSSQTTNNDQSKIIFQPLKYGTDGRKLSLSENLISNSFKKDEANEVNASNFHSTTSTLNSSTLTSDETKKSIENKLRSNLPKTFQAAVIDPLSVRDKKSIRIKNKNIQKHNDNCEVESRPRSPSLSFFQSSPKIIRKRFAKTSALDSEKTHSSHLDLPEFSSKVDKHIVDTPAIVKKSKKWQTRRVKERQTSESSDVVYVTGTSVFQRALRYTKSYDESLFPCKEQSFSQAESNLTTSEASIETKNNCVLVHAENINETNLKVIESKTELRGADCLDNICSKRFENIENESSYSIGVREQSKTSDYYSTSSMPSCSNFSTIIQAEPGDYNNNNKVYKSKFSHTLKQHVNDLKNN